MSDEDLWATVRALPKGGFSAAPPGPFSPANGAQLAQAAERAVGDKPRSKGKRCRAPSGACQHLRGQRVELRERQLAAGEAELADERW
ncbi:MAG: hypothetical protein RL033_2512 [Pseudomonadota bacterium]